MVLRYYDASIGEHRFKRRYVWAFWGFTSGLLFGSILVLVLH